MWAVALAWLLTLFPVSGAIKVGTSIADRIVVPTTFAFAMFGGRLLTALLLNIGKDKSDQTEQKGPTFARTRSVSQRLLLHHNLLRGLLLFPYCSVPCTNGCTDEVLSGRIVYRYWKAAS